VVTRPVRDCQTRTGVGPRPVLRPRIRSSHANHRRPLQQCCATAPAPVLRPPPPDPGRVRCAVRSLVVHRALAGQRDRDQRRHRRSRHRRRPGRVVAGAQAGGARHRGREQASTGRRDATGIAGADESRAFGAASAGAVRAETCRPSSRRRCASPPACDSGCRAAHPGPDPQRSCRRTPRGDGGRRPRRLKAQPGCQPRRARAARRRRSDVSVPRNIIDSMTGKPVGLPSIAT
jgi:hypothetical protein